jgi:TRAP-type mannitol/chloroaromatic compound transport system substrate-binding protein
MSGGRLQIEFFGGGELMPTPEGEDALTKGVVDALNGYGAFWDGIVGKVGTLEAACTTYMPPYKQRHLIDNTDFLKIVRAAWADANVHYVYPRTGHPLGDYVFSAVKLDSIEDLKGLPFRSAGATAEILTELGAATAYFPFDEIYTALETGVVKAAEYGDMTTFYEIGLHKVANYWYLPAIVQGGFNANWVNMDSWNALPDDLKVIVETAAKAHFPLMGTDRFVNDEIHLQKAIAEGVIVGHWTPEEMDMFVTAWIKVMDNLAASGDPYVAELWQVVKETRIFLREWPE